MLTGPPGPFRHMIEDNSQPLPKKVKEENSIQVEGSEVC